jgi:CHAD domain-containing protein
MTRTNSSELVIRQRLAALARALPAARKGDVNGVHQSRVATRRLREALPLLLKKKAWLKLRSRVRKLTRALGPVRELDVALITLDEVERSGTVPGGGLRRLRQFVREERARLFIEMTRQIDRFQVHKLQKSSLGGLEQETTPKSRDRLVRRRIARADARAARRGDDVRAAIENAAGIYLPDRLHFVRIRVKKLRYAIEIARELRGSRAMSQLRTLKRAQDLLGRMHDLEMLIARTRAVQSTATLRDLKASGDLDQLVRRLEMECRQLHVRYMNERKALLAICDHVAALAEQHRASAS